MLVKTFAAAVRGIEAVTVTVEVNIISGAQFVIVGLPDAAVKESRQRIDSALREISERIPGKRVIINMAPADLKKEGASFDLPIAIAILAANGRLHTDMLETTMILGELSLDGMLKPLKGALPITIAARQAGFQRIILPLQNMNEARAIKGIESIGFERLADVVAYLSGSLSAEQLQREIPSPPAQPPHKHLDFSDVKGQENAKRALEIAACGSHNLLLIGPPGSGKSMLSKRVPTILPPMTEEEALETTKIHSVAGLLPRGSGIMRERPFRAPHHSTTETALIGGGGFPKPGEISLATNGCLYLDELPEFKRHILELLRQPLEDKQICITRNSGVVTYPANFILIASMNPCPCGYYTHPTHECNCGEWEIKRYLSKLSGPLLDRIDMHISVAPVEIAYLSNSEKGESSSTIKERVVAGRRIQTERFRGVANLYSNSQMDSSQIRKYCALDSQSRQLLVTALEKMGASARTYDRILKVSRTIADLRGSENISSTDIAEALQYRCLDRSSWGA